MKSMTGYGAARLDSASLKAAVVAKAWNNRFLDLAVLAPAFLGPIERRVRNLVESRPHVR
ncbi:hypothetical protein MASR2M48_08150 [Spirochaetota bacterium]